MKKVTKILAMLMAFAMIFTVAGCRKNNGDDTSSTSDTTGSDVLSNTSGTEGEKSEDSGSSQQGTQAGTSPTTSAAKNTLNFGGATVTIIYEYQPASEYGIDASRDRELDRVKELNKKYNVTIDMKKGGSNYNETIVSSIAAGSPVGNIIRVNGNSNYDFIRAGLCASLNDAMQQTGINMTDSKYKTNSLKYYNVNGNQYAMSYNVPQESPSSGNLWYYNKNILKELGYGEGYINELYSKGQWNWDAVSNLAKAATKTNSDGTASRYGLGFSYAYVGVQYMVLANGGHIGSVAKDGSPSCNFDSKEIREALTQAYQWGAVDKVLYTGGGDGAIGKFGKGEIFMMSGAGNLAKIFYNAGVNFGLIYGPTGPSNGQTVVVSNPGDAFIVPVTYQNDAAKYLMLMDELYAPYADATNEEILKADQINYFSDADSWNVFRNAAFDTSLKRASDDFSAFNLQWIDPAFSTVCENLVKGTLTAGTMIEKYNDQYQAVLDDLFNGYKLTGVNK